jgi:ATP-dependent DNA ligase
VAGGAASPGAMPSGFVPPCIPTRAAPGGPDWVHEIKHDGYRLQVRRDGDTVRLFTRRGYDWTERYPAIAGTTAMQLRATSFTLDGEAVVCGPDGVAIFDALHRRSSARRVMASSASMSAMSSSVSAAVARTASTTFSDSPVVSR